MNKLSKRLAAGKDKLDQLTPQKYINWRVQSTMVARYELQDREPYCATEIHAVRMNDMALVTNPFDSTQTMPCASRLAVQLCKHLSCSSTSDCHAYLPDSARSWRRIQCSHRRRRHRPRRRPQASRKKACACSKPYGKRLVPGSAWERTAQEAPASLPLSTNHCTAIPIAADAIAVEWG